MLAERFAKAAASIPLTAHLTLDGVEITTAGYAPQSATFTPDGTVTTATASFEFAGRALFDAVEWREAGELVHKSAVAFDAPRGAYTAALEVEVG